MIVFCGNCKARYQLPDSRKGVRFRCKVCQAAVYTDDKRRIGPEEKDALTKLEHTPAAAPPKPETDKRRNRLREIREEAKADTLALLRKQHEEEENLLFGEGASSPDAVAESGLLEEPGFREEDLFGDEQEATEPAVTEELAPAAPPPAPEPETPPAPPQTKEAAPSPVDAFLAGEKEDAAPVADASTPASSTDSTDAGAYLELDDAPAENAWLEEEAAVAEAEEVPVTQPDGLALDTEEESSTSEPSPIALEQGEEPLALAVDEEPELDTQAEAVVEAQVGEEAENEAQETPASGAADPGLEEDALPLDVEEESASGLPAAELDQATPVEPLDRGEETLPVGAEPETSDTGAKGLTFLSDAEVQDEVIPEAPRVGADKPASAPGVDTLPEEPEADADCLDLAPFRLDAEEAASRTLVPVVPMPAPIRDASALTWLGEDEVDAPLLVGITMCKQEDGTCVPDRSRRAYCKGCQSRYRLPSSYGHRKNLKCGVCDGEVVVLAPGMRDPGSAVASMLERDAFGGEDEDFEDATPAEGLDALDDAEEDGLDEDLDDVEDVEDADDLDDATPPEELDDLDDGEEDDLDADLDDVEDVEDADDLDDATPTEELDDLDDVEEDDLDADLDDVEDVEDADDLDDEDEELDDFEEEEEIELGDIPDEDLDIEVFDDDKNG